MNLQDLIEQLSSSTPLPPAVLHQIQQAMDDPSKLDELLKVLADLGARDMGSGPPLNIDDYYQPGVEPFDLRWSLTANLPLPFEQLDHKTQFYVLFQEWTRREMEGLFALDGGNLPESMTIFKECLQRALQLEVAELIARSYENMAKVADHAGKRAEGRRYARKAAAARAG
jgi:hypothetical protein